MRFGAKVAVVVLLAMLVPTPGAHATANGTVCLKPLAVPDADFARGQAVALSLPLALPGSSGADDLRWNIAHCEPADLGGGALAVEPGNMSGPIAQGASDLIALDPGAYWDAAANVVAGSGHPGTSPRIAVVVAYDPGAFAAGKGGRNASVVVARFIVVFFEAVVGGEIRARYLGPLAPGVGGLD